jgi:hypothetical protein
VAILLVGLVVSAGCQNLAEPTTTNDISAAAPKTTGTDYPSLHTVPPRPQLSYTVQQQRAIVDGLVADRANARYTDQVVRYRTGRSTLPPPPAPPPVVAAVEPEVPAKPKAPSTSPGAAAPSQAKASDTAGGGLYPSAPSSNSLGDFLDQLMQDSAPPPAAAGAAAEGTKSGGSGWFDWLRELFGQADDPAQPSAAASPAAGPSTAAPVAASATVAASAPIAAGGPPEAEAALAVLVAETRPAFQPAPELQPAMAPGRADHGHPAVGTEPISQTVAASEGSAPVRPDPGGVGIAIGDGGVAVEVGAPAAKPAPAIGASARTPAAAISGIGTSASDSSIAETAAGRVAFAPGSAALPDGIGPQLEEVLATARTEGALIRIVGEADAPALALDRARAVAIALVRLGARAGDLKMTLAPDAAGNQARLLLAPPAAH